LKNKSRDFQAPARVQTVSLRKPNGKAAKSLTSAPGKALEIAEKQAVRSNATKP
jgi:hypothetical protein